MLFLGPRPPPGTLLCSHEAADGHTQAQAVTVPAVGVTTTLVLPGEAQVFSLTVGPELGVHSFLPGQPGCVPALASVLPLLGQVPLGCSFGPCLLWHVLRVPLSDGAGPMWSLEILPRG